MKKQVTFAQKRTVYKLRKDEALLRINGVTESKIAADDVTFNNRVKIHKWPTAKYDHTQTILIPQSLSAAPFLKHSVLTPAQKEYLNTIAASYSPELVRNIINQHYMNVLHRCIRAGHNPENYVVSTPVNPDQNAESPQTKPAVSSEVTNKGKTNTSVKNVKKTVLPKIHKRQPRVVKTSASKHRRKATTSPKTRRKNPKPVPVKLDEDDEDDEDINDIGDIDDEYKDDYDDDDEGHKPDDSLSDYLSSLSLTDWDDDDSLSDV